MTSFVTCSIRCRNCGLTLAEVNTLGTSIPRRKLYTAAKERGMVQDSVSNVFCGHFCRTEFRMSHASHRVDSPVLPRE